MFEGLFDTIDAFDSDVYRNIPSLRVSEDLLDDLSDRRSDRAVGEALVEATVRRDSALSSIITAPFTYGVRVGGLPFGSTTTRFSDGSRYGVWYGSLDLITTVHETVHHWKRRLSAMLRDIDEDVVSERRVYLVHAQGMLVDLRGKHRKFPGLIDKNSYAFTHAVGAYLHDQGMNGLLVASARYREGTNIAAFRPEVLSAPRHHCYLTYRWKKRSDTVTVERAKGKRWLSLR